MHWVGGWVGGWGELWSEVNRKGERRRCIAARLNGLILMCLALLVRYPRVVLVDAFPCPDLDWLSLHMAGVADAMANVESIYEETIDLDNSGVAGSVAHAILSVLCFCGVCLSVCVYPSVCLFVSLLSLTSFCM